MTTGQPEGGGLRPETGDRLHSNQLTQDHGTMGLKAAEGRGRPDYKTRGQETGVRGECHVLP